MATKQLNLIEGGNLNVGSRGASVSQLQQILKQFGYYPGAVDGVYGPQTKEAVRMFQTDNKITTDGIFGPVTQSKLLEWQQNPIKAQVNDPIVKDAMAKDPNLAQSLYALENEGGNRAALVAAAGEAGKKGYYLGVGFTAKPELMQKLYDISKKELDPVFNEALQFYANDFQASLEKEKADYESSLAKTESQFLEDRFAMENDQARRGIFKSSLGRENRAGLVEGYNRGLEDMERDTKYKLSDIARNFESKYGTNEVNKYRTKLPTSSVGWWDGASRGRTNAFTAMGNNRGSLNRQYEAQIGQYGKQKLDSLTNSVQ